MKNTLIHFVLIASLMLSQVVLASDILPCRQMSGQSHTHSQASHSHMLHDMGGAMDKAVDGVMDHDMSNHGGHNSKAMSCCGDDCACIDGAFHSFTLTTLAFNHPANSHRDAIAYQPYFALNADKKGLIKPPSF